MHIHYVTCSHAWGDDYGDVDVPSLQDHRNSVNRHEDRLTDHEDQLIKQRSFIDSISKTVSSQVNEMREHKDRLEQVEQQVNDMPQILHEALDQILEESVVSQLDTFSKQLETFKAERLMIPKQTEEIHNLREVLENGIKEMKKQCAAVSELLADLQRQCDETRHELEAAKVAKDECLKQAEQLKSMVFIPRWFSRFLFTRTKA